MSRRVRTAWGRMVACRQMAVLVSLLTVAALAIAGWLAFGLVTVRSVAEPARIGLLSPPQIILAFLVPLLALEWIAARYVRGRPSEACRAEPWRRRKSGGYSPRGGGAIRVGGRGMSAADPDRVAVAAVAASGPLAGLDRTPGGRLVVCRGCVCIR